MKRIPKKARILIFYGAFLIATPSMMSLYHGNTGEFLVAMGGREGDPFHETVIYINRHDLWGAHGVVINRPARAKDFKTPSPERAWKVDLMNGGPVNFGTSDFLLVPHNGVRHGFWIVDIPTLRKHQQDFCAQMDRRENTKPLKLFSGYAGWGPLQLNVEFARGAWAAVDYDEDLMFQTPPGEIWKKATKKVLKERPAVKGGA